MTKFYLKIAFIYLFILGLFSIPFLQRYVVDSKLKNTPAVENNGEHISATPERITIPSLNIDLPIESGEYNQATWTLSTNKAVFANNTSLVNNFEGNTLIYGHNTNAVFYATERLVEGDKAFIYTKNGLTFVYEYKSSELVSPKDTNIFSYSGPPRLTLLTCNGFTSSQRRLMYFSFSKTI